MINHIDSISQEPDGLNKFVLFRNDFIFINIPLNSINKGYWKRIRIKTNVGQSYSVCKSRAIFHIATLTIESMYTPLPHDRWSVSVSETRKFQ